MKKAIKTEYKGIVFDSKSEAVFARALDLVGHEWAYHPSNHAGHEWDFLVFPKVKVRPFKRTRRIELDDYEKPVVVSDYSEMVATGYFAPFLVEYKPSPPTKTYIRNLIDKLSKSPVESILVWGNPWEYKRNFVNENNCYHTYPLYCSYGSYGWGDFIQEADNGEDVPVSNIHTTWDILRMEGGESKKAKEYRFDLR